MATSETLLLGLNVLFVTGAVVSLAVIAGTWRAMRGAVLALCEDMAREERPREFRYTVTTLETRRPAARVIELPIRLRPALPPLRSQPGLRAAA